MELNVHLITLTGVLGDLYQELTLPFVKPLLNGITVIGRNSLMLCRCLSLRKLMYSVSTGRWTRMMQSVEQQANAFGLRNDMNLIYTLSNLISTLTKIDTDDSKAIAILSAHTIYRTAGDLIRHVEGLYSSKEAKE